MYGKTIRKDNGYDANSYTYYPVAIIGAGESGIAMGCRLKEVLGFDQFRIFDRQSGIGGTWSVIISSENISLLPPEVQDTLQFMEHVSQPSRFPYKAKLTPRF